MGRNDFCGITKEMVLDKTSNLNMDRESYSFTYSNYGYAVLGLVLEAVYDTDYTTLYGITAEREIIIAILALTLKQEQRLSCFQTLHQITGSLPLYWE